MPQISSSTEFHDDYEAGLSVFCRILLHFLDSVQLDVESRRSGAPDGQQLLVVEGSGGSGVARSFSLG